MNAINEHSLLNYVFAITIVNQIIVFPRCNSTFSNIKIPIYDTLKGQWSLENKCFDYFSLFSCSKLPRC